MWLNGRARLMSTCSTLVFPRSYGAIPSLCPTHYHGVGCLGSRGCRVSAAGSGCYAFVE